MESFKKDVGLDEEIRKIGIPVDKRAIHLQDGKLNYQFYGKEGEAIFSLSRGVLNRKMVDLAEAEGVEFFFERKNLGYQFSNCYFIRRRNRTRCLVKLKYDKVFGADGAFRELDIECNDNLCLIIRKNSWKSDTRNYTFQLMQMVLTRLIKIHYIFGKRQFHVNGIS